MFIIGKRYHSLRGVVSLSQVSEIIYNEFCRRVKTKISQALCPNWNLLFDNQLSHFVEILQKIQHLNLWDNKLMK